MELFKVVDLGQARFGLYLRPNKVPTHMHHAKLAEKHGWDSIWKNDVDKCLSCGACTMHCPTCNCFDIQDILDADLKSGKRVRHHASCQLKSFSIVPNKTFCTFIVA